MLGSVISTALVSIAMAWTATLAPAAHVWTVGASGQDFTTIQEAVDIAADGDVVVVRGGTTSLSFGVLNKSVHVTTEGSAVIDLPNGIGISNLALGKTVTLRGFRTYLTFHSNAGRLRVEDCELRGNPFGIFPDPGAHLTAFAEATFVHCTISGGTNAKGTSAGIRAIGGKLVLDHCQVVGGRGRPGGFVGPIGVSAGGPGGPGMFIENTQVFLSGTHVAGGDGGGGVSGDCSVFFGPSGGGDGGDGVENSGVSTLYELDSTFVGGAGGNGGSGTVPGCMDAPDGAPGVAFTAPLPTRIPIAGSSRELESLPPADGGALCNFRAHGLPGDRVYLAASITSAHELELPLNGVRAFGLPARRAILGTIDASGILDMQLLLPALPPGSLGTVRYVQAVIVDASGQGWLATPATLIMLDPSL
jgi:hypothetical protein